MDVIIIVLLEFVWCSTMTQPKPKRRWSEDGHVQGGWPGLPVSAAQEALHPEPDIQPDEEIYRFLLALTTWPRGPSRAATQLDGAKRWQEAINETRAKCMRRVEAFHFRNVRTETEEAEQGLIRSDDDDDDDDDWLLSGDLNCHLVMILIHPEFDLKSMTIIIIFYNFKIEWHSINTSSEPHWTTWIKVPINLLLKLFGSSLVIGRFDVLILIVIIILISLFFPFWLHRHHRNLAKARQLVVFWWFLIHFNHRVP